MKTNVSATFTFKVHRSILLSAIFCLLLPPLDGYSQNTLENVEKHVYTLAADSMMGRPSGTVHSAMAAEYIVREFMEIGVEPMGTDGYFQPFSIHNHPMATLSHSFRNVVGVIEGDDPELKEEYLVIGAHYDHLGARLIDGDSVIYNGADDNASGVAAMLETARLLKDRQDGLRRSIIFVAFDAEEWGVHGSKHFVNDPPVPLEGIKFMASLDMVGWYAQSGLLYLYGTGTIADSHELLGFVDVPAGLKIEPKRFETGLFTGTDTEPFARKGIPTIHVTTGTVSPYHKPEDTADKIDYPGLSMVSEYISSLSYEISRWEDYRESGKVSKRHKGGQPLFEAGITAGIGSNTHHYTSGPLTGKSGLAASVGLTSQFNFGIFGLRPEVMYEYMSTPHPMERLHTHAVTVPLSLVLQTPYFSGFGVNVSFGGYYTRRFDGKQAGRGADFSGTYYRNEGGLQFGIGFRVANIGIGCTAKYALTDMYRKNISSSEIRNRATYFNMTYYF